MNVYYEISDCLVSDKGKYFVAYDVHKGSASTSAYYSIMMNSDRAWAEEEDGTVRFLKHRFADIPLVQVDMKEFFWVKLKSQTV